MTVVLSFPDDREHHQHKEMCPRVGETVFIEEGPSYVVIDVQHQYRKVEHGIIHLMAIVILGEV